MALSAAGVGRQVLSAAARLSCSTSSAPLRATISSVTAASATSSSLLPSLLCATHRATGATSPSHQREQRRFLNLHEYQSMRIMKEFHITTPKFAVASTAKEAEQEAATFLSESPSGDGEPVDFVVKAQVLAGGRGLGFFRENGYQGGVQVCESPREVGIVAEKMLGKTLVTKQTGKEGKLCNKVLVTERFFIRKEKYVAILMDRGAGGPILIGSARGGTSIEDIAHNYPESIHKMPIDINQGISEPRLREFAELLGFSGDRLEAACQCIRGLYELFRSKDCTQIEVNPLVETHDGRVLVCDAKLNFDDNAGFRQKDIFSQRDYSQEDPREVAADAADLNYIGLEGSIGCMVNGAGLAMATMDIIHLHGGSPANFLDVGGGADQHQIIEALKIIQQDKRANCVLVNIFGGIMRCDVIAKGLVAAAKEVGFDKPVVLRLEGTNKEAAKEVLKDVLTDPAYSALQLLQEDDFDKAAQLAVKVASVVDAAAKANLKVHISAP
ncbi:putative succinate-Coenzyme A ligase, beta subunit [Toxoplasma gondii TgCatPRC2]|uniref:Succinate--CoA ligase [ADP-forming] subunit beta, mitochondrial n=14 Tax=Toxoplasma gondii TaxID=5811 RepID=A0A0F7V455_TOXGV|nr:succinate-Coenzyme A ligase, beta subunit, putative [Toxoplasma gondii ME49]ABE76512.1 mitochondrial putative ATP-specific succinyl-CoA synthetase beta subunit [Toxoplasma gondii]EPR60837.1 putative succinate-Coenzyme A ligase, beta subunit [Toxoplasma gondii GT1]ESS34792.1 putative succinate-Coenzyme A ligase, beta subunit [Toxoplasma gondii VEG]KFG44668.1 putative succinate-Coenzyme A ligase, beta subunit [Toxoplasma gondii GAB2-2007-GAL-DOM2]KFG55731.1 putative succinate-Coenzyme A ligas|eukprot:XP_002364222.1 succinate-Coenzyme A ligase, beta subunit, putative [Toxoplasma gondii ME49]